MTTEPSSNPLRVLIAGGGVAGIETLLALRDLAGSRVAVTILAPNSEFIYAPMSVREPFAGAAAGCHSLSRIADDMDAELVCDALEWVAPGQHAAFTRSGAEIGYDAMVVALGARRETAYEKVTTFRGGEDSEAVRGLVQDVEGGFAGRIAFVVPPGITWTLPLYELALMTAARARDMGTSPELTFVTPEEQPLGVFGPEAAAELAGLLEAAGIELEASAYAEVEGGQRVVLRPAGRTIHVDRIVALPRLHGPAPRGLPADENGFIPVDSHGRVRGVKDVYAAGDGVQFPIKQGGLAAQQADAVAEVIAKRAGGGVTAAQSFRPVMRGMILTGDKERYLKSEPTGGRGATSQASAQSLWWPPAKIAGRYLAPYLAGDDAIRVEDRREGLEVELALGESQPRVRRRALIAPDARGHAAIQKLDPERPE